MRRIALLLLSFLSWVCLALPGFAANAQPDVFVGKIEAHPALWTVHGPKGTAYLFGSIHILPPNMEWRTPKVAAAMKAADTFVFEIPMDESTKQSIANFVRAHAFLPKGTTLPSLLDGKADKDYRDALAASGISAAALIDKRPWFAALVIEVGYMNQRNLSPDAGVDRRVYADALARGVKDFRALETPEEQFRLLMPEDRDLEIKEFDESLKEVLRDKGELGNLIDAWASGDEARLGKLMNEGLKADPRMEKALFEDRNARWVNQIAAMLNENRTFFITVGAGHLAGPKGVPALLRQRGFKVDGP